MHKPTEFYEVAQPDKWEFHGSDDVAIKQMFLERAGYVVPQHAHDYDHTSMVAAGGVAVWCEDEFLGAFWAPTGLTIKAHKKHMMQALSDRTVVYCIHNLHGRKGELDDVLVSEKHEIKD